MSRAGRGLAVCAIGAALVAFAPVVPARAAAPAAITLSVSPTCSPALAGLRIDVRGEGFDPFTAVLVTFDAAAGGRPQSFEAGTDGFGRFDVVIEPGLRPAGSYLLRADDFREREATATAVVGCSVPPSPPPVFHPALAFHPAIARRGFLVDLAGSGFPPGAPVRLDWGDLRGRGIVTDVTADGAGAFAVRGFLVFVETPFGSDRVLATPARTGAFGPVTAKLLVVPGPAEPPIFASRS